MTDRRRFLQYAAGAAGLAGLHAAGLFAARPAGAAVKPAFEKLSILFLGGTGFIGPHQVEYALARDHRVTVFNRGRKSGLFGDRIEELTGNRDDSIDDGLAALRNDRTWDVVVDNSGYVPRHVRDSVELLGDRCGRYVYVSTVAAYPSAPGVYREDAPLAELEDKSVEQVTWETYGPLKAECDRIVREALGDKATVVRPTFIVGPGDTSDRFTWWCERIHRGGDIIGPAHRDVTVQTVDARDMCPWIINLAENGTSGAFNAAGPVYTREGLLWGIAATQGRDFRFHWLTPELAEELEMPMPMLDWGTESREFPGQASRTAGLDYRPLADSVAGTLAWWKEQTEERRNNARGWPLPEQEKAAMWKLRG